jgi:hypothetical protein
MTPFTPLEYSELAEASLEHDQETALLVYHQVWERREIETLTEQGRL